MALIALGQSGPFDVHSIELGTTLTGDGKDTPFDVADDGITTDKLADDAITTVKITDSNVTLAKVQNIATERLLGRSAAGAGVVEEIQLGTNISLTAGTLNVTASTPVIASINDAGTSTMLVKYTGASAPTLAGAAGAYTLTIPSGTIIDYFQWFFDNTHLTGGGDMSLDITWTGAPVNNSEADAMYPSTQYRLVGSDIIFNPGDNSIQFTQSLGAAGVSNLTITSLTGIGGTGANIIANF